MTRDGRKVFLEARGLHVDYGQGPVLDRIDLKISAGEKVLLVGESGSGKSTLIKSLYGLEPAMQGEIFFRGQRMHAGMWSEFRRHDGFMGQKPVDFSGSVGDFLALPFALKANRHLVFSPQKAEDLLHALNLSSISWERNVRDLSGGQQQRLTLAQCLLLQRGAYFLDEVTSSLDAENAARAVDVICSDRAGTIVAVDHGPHWPKTTVVYEMRQGKLHRRRDVRSD